jgi:hypothetical protein
MKKSAILMGSYLKNESLQLKSEEKMVLEIDSFTLKN